MLTVVTLNLLKDMDDWAERETLIVQELLSLSPDLVALQEVRLPQNSAQRIADRLQGYSVHLCPKMGRQSGREALVILSRLPVDDHETLSLGFQDRVAQRVTVQYAGQRWVFANVHLYYSLTNDARRSLQVQQLIDWLPQAGPSIVCGDFNAMPGAQSMRTMRRRFASAFACAAGHEPPFTFPTHLRRGPGLRRLLQRVILYTGGVLLQRRWAPFRATLDYIFVDPAIRVHDCHVAFQQPSDHAAAIFASDHLGLAAVLEVTSSQDPDRT